MTRTRWTGLAGVLFGVAFFGIGALAGSTPDVGASDAPERFARYWNDNDHQSRAFLAALLVSYVFLLLLAFTVGLRDRLRSVDAGPLPTLALAAGTAASVLIAAGGMVSTAVGVTGDGSGGFEADGGTALLLDNLGYQLLASALMAAAVMVVATGLVSMRTRVLPVWTAWFGFVIGLAALGSFFSAWTGFFLLPAWCLVVGLVLLLQKDAHDADGTTGVDSAAEV